jgi:hypothetical protein
LITNGRILRAGELARCDWALGRRVGRNAPGIGDWLRAPNDCISGTGEKKSLIVRTRAGFVTGTGSGSR